MKSKLVFSWWELALRQLNDNCNYGGVAYASKVRSSNSMQLLLPKWKMVNEL